MTRTSARAKKSKQDVIKKKEAKSLDENQTDSEGAAELTDKENDDKNYDVEKITHTRIFKGKRQYLVRWKGYTEDSDTWENESVLQSCKDILDAFKKEHLAEANSEDEEEEEGAEEKEKTKGKKVSKKAKNNTKKTFKETDEESDVDSEKPLKKKGPKGKVTGRLSRGKNLSVSYTETEEEPEEEELEETEEKDKDKSFKKTDDESDVDSEKPAKKKGPKGKKTGKSPRGKNVDSDRGTEEELEEDEVEVKLESKGKESKGKKRKSTKQTESSEVKKTKKDESDDESVTDGKDYEVEKILEVHTRKDGSREFLIRWKGYKPSDDTWEPEAHLNCYDLIDKFMEKVDKAKQIPTKELRQQRSETKRFVPLNPRRNTQRNKGFRPCYQESYED